MNRRVPLKENSSDSQDAEKKSKENLEREREKQRVETQQAVELNASKSGARRQASSL